MDSQNNYELFYDVLDKTVQILYEIRHDDFFTLLIATSKNIIAGEVLDKDATVALKKRLNRWYDKLDDVEFSVEDIRKAFQVMSLRAFKETNMSVGEVTPDTIGILFSYLIEKLAPKKESLNILDPVVGCGNLLYTTANHLDTDVKLFGIDNVYNVLEISNALGNLLDYDVEMFNQDTLSKPFKDMDFVVADLPDYYVEEMNNEYFPYLCVVEHLASLKDDGYMLTVVPNDFFSKDKNHFFKDNLAKLGSVIAVLQLPLNMFKANPKSIVIFGKQKISGDKCLLLELPDFKNMEDFNDCLTKMEFWFDNNLNK